MVWGSLFLFCQIWTHNPWREIQDRRCKTLLRSSGKLRCRRAVSDETSIPASMIRSESAWEQRSRKSRHMERTGMSHWKHVLQNTGLVTWKICLCKRQFFHAQSLLVHWQFFCPYPLSSRFIKGTIWDRLKWVDSLRISSRTSKKWCLEMLQELWVECWETCQHLSPQWRCFDWNFSLG